MITPLTEFLLARIAEDEKVAREATPGPWQWWNLDAADQGWCGQGPTLETVARGPVYSDGSQGAAADVIDAWGHDAWGITVSDADATHIARHDPARVLAECEAKRRIAERLQRVVTDVNSGDLRGFYADATHDCARDLAAVYADHPDYDEVWRL